jgi:hypothetical protein
MRSKAICALLLIAVLALPAAFAQEGYPLVGTWYGEWGSTGKRNQLTFIMSWDGKTITAIINPGADAMQLKQATLDSKKWTVHFEIDGKDEKGQPAHFIADGKLEDVGSHNRTIAGTWTAGATKADFKLRRD